MKVTEKAPELGAGRSPLRGYVTCDALLTSLTGRDRKASNQICNWCGGPAAEFREELSRREYSISGMCQKCQDATFTEEDE